MKRVSQYQNKDMRVTLSIELHSGQFITLTVPPNLLENNLRESSLEEVIGTIGNAKEYIIEDQTKHQANEQRLRLS